ncbi:MAG: efflux RND transporter permease subunit [Candidatus Cloacimonetes bacterium]|nr:efflux RND transporter permease subunit [Candidatus Cloacimonadota bacterium]
MFLSKISIKRPVMITMLVLVFIVFGIIAYSALPLNLMPVIDMPFVTVQTIYPGAGPKEVEVQITKKIEDEISTISQIDFVESYSMDNVSFVMIRFELGKDVNVANQEVKDKVESIVNQFPNAAERPSIEKYDPSERAILNLVFTGNQSLIQLYEFADKTLKDRLAQIEGVAKVNVSGGQEREIHVKLDNKVVYQNAISIPQLSQSIAQQNMDMPSGHFVQKDQEYTVRLDGEFDIVKELRNLDVQTPFGSKKLKQVANVKDTGSEIRKRTTFFSNVDKLRNENLIRIGIVKSSEGNPVEISQNVHKELKTLKKEVPVGTELKVVNDDSDFIKSSVEDTLSNVILGIIFTGIILLFFLHDLRSTFIVALAMPTSIISTFLLMHLSGFSLNILSLMGLSTSVGILVTNSVVVIENIFRHKQKGHGRKDSADKGTAEVAVAVIAATLTNIVVFLPLAMMNTIAGQFLVEFAVTVVFATIFSLFISFTLTPMLSSIILPEKPRKHKFGMKLENLFHRCEKGYSSLLRKMFTKKARSIAIVLISFGLFVLTLLTVAPHIGFEFMPNMDEGNLTVDFELPQGYALNATQEVCKKIEKKITVHDEVKNVLATTGAQGWIDESTNLGRIQVQLVDIDKRDVSTQKFANILIEELAKIPNAKINVSVGSSVGGGAEIDFFLQGQELSKLAQYEEVILEKAKEVPGLLNFDSDYRAGKPEITLSPKRNIMANAGVSINELAMTLRGSIEGIKASYFRDAGYEYDIKVALTENSVDTPDKIRNIPVVTQSGRYRMSQLADVEYTKTTNKIVHRDKFTTIEFTGQVGAGYAQSSVVNDLQKIIDNLDLPTGYRVSWAGMSEMMQENNREMGQAFMLAILLTYMLLAAILESFTKPFMILLTLPLAMIGVFLALYITGQMFNMVSMMAVIMLIGIVVNAAILILDYTRQEREQGVSTIDALCEAGRVKLKPVVMSSVAIMLGMLPMALGIGASGAQMRQALGIVSIGGILVATGLTLFVIPALFYLTTKAEK